MIGRARGQAHGEHRRSGAAVDADGAAVRLDHGRDDGQPQPGATGLTGPRRVTPGEPLEHLGLQRLWNARAVIADYADVENVFLVIVAVPAVIAELWFTLWLLTRGGKRLAPSTES